MTLNARNPLVAAGLLLFALTSLAAPPSKPKPVVTTQVVERPLLEEASLLGSAEVLRESAISPRLAGVVERIHVAEGDVIEAGQTLLELDSALAQLDVSSARAQVDEALARHKDAQRRKSEYQSLINSRAVASTSLASAVADEQATRAAVRRQRAELKRAEEVLSRHTLVAPFSGLVVDKRVETAEWVKVDSPVITLVALDRIRVRAAVSQRYYRNIQPGAAVRVIFDALPGKTFNGNVTALVAVGERTTRSFPLLIELASAQRQIAPGMSARVFVELSTGQHNALLVPRDAVVLKADGSRVVWKVSQAKDKSTVTPVPLQIGRSQDDLVEVLDSSLKAGDSIVLLGNESLRPGMAVKPRVAE